jgi:hypothetical protein
MKPNDATEMRTFEELECWKACRKLRIWVRKSCIAYLNRSARAAKD